MLRAHQPLARPFRRRRPAGLAVFAAALAMAIAPAAAQASDGATPVASAFPGIAEVVTTPPVDAFSAAPTTDAPAIDAPPRPSPTRPPSSSRPPRPSRSPIPRPTRSP